MTVRLSGELSDFATSNVGQNGSFDNMSEYIRSLIREDKSRQELKSFNLLKTELQMAFTATDDSYSELSALDIINRNQSEK
ncbi:MAG: addiction module antitoxin [Gammaproteobacteria bacterium]|nr:MAG: addiction module antitoxin [Gammaproteobacteria bacterium]